MKITPEMNEQIVEEAFWRWQNYGYFGDIADTEKYQNDSWEWDDVKIEYNIFMRNIGVIYSKE